MLFIEMCVWCITLSSAHVKTENTITNMNLLPTQMTIFLFVNLKKRCLFVKFNGEMGETQFYCLYLCSK